MRWILVAAGLLMANMAWSAPAAWIAESDAHALAVLKAQAAFQPEGASAAGLSEFDTAVMDLGPNLYAREQAADRATLDALDKALAEATDTRVRQDLAILRQSVADGITSREIDHRLMLPYAALHEGLFHSFNRLLDPRNDASRYAAALIRLRRYAGLEAGFAPLVDQAQALARERFDDAGLVGPWRAEVENDLTNAPRFIAGMRQLFERAGLNDWEAPFSALEKQLNAHAAWVKAQILPRARADNRLPEELYADNLKQFGVRETPERLIEQAQAAYQANASEMKAVARQIAARNGWKEADLISVIRQLKQQTIAPDAVLGVYTGRLKELEAIIRREKIVTLPERAASIRLATEAESAATPASFMSPPQLIGNTGQYGEFVLVQSNPGQGEGAQMDDFNHDGIVWTLTAHEARPGHELQFASMVENGVSLARSLFAFNSANVEGWGLYAEAVMYEHLPLEGQLFSLYSRAWRAARMFLDPMVNTGRMTRDDAARFLEEHLAMSPAMAASEADRYAYRMPGQATAYYYGYQKLMALRTEVEIRLGDAFDQRAFHDAVIAQGLLPPQMLREAVMAALSVH